MITHLKEIMPVRIRARHLWFFCFLSLALTFCHTGWAKNSTKKTPRLLFFLIIDGLGYEALQKHLHRLDDRGFKRILDQSTQFTQAHFQFASTFTAPGHATIATGTFPRKHGIVGNTWHDNILGKSVYSTADKLHPSLGEKSKKGGSPNQLLTPTLSDYIYAGSGRETKTLALSIKDRAAILTGGIEGTAYFYSKKTGRFITTEYYMDKYPGWWQNYFEIEPQKKLGETYKRLGKTSVGTEYLVDFARAAVQGHEIGKNENAEFPDTLVLSISSHDSVNHGYGPESEESIVDLIRVNDAIADFLVFLDSWVGLKKTLMVMTADHGFSYSPEYCLTKDKIGGRLSPDKIKRDFNHFLADKFNTSRLAKEWQPQSIYLDQDKIRRKGILLHSLDRKGKAYLQSLPGIAEVFTRTELTPQARHEGVAQKVYNGWHPDRSGDFVLVQKPCWYLLRDPFSNRATHGSPYPYDTHVPLVLKGSGLPIGKFDRPVAVASVVPTLAYHFNLLSLRDMYRFDGEVLTELYA